MRRAHVSCATRQELLKLWRFSPGGWVPPVTPGAAGAASRRTTRNACVSSSASGAAPAAAAGALSGCAARMLLRKASCTSSSVGASTPSRPSTRFAACTCEAVTRRRGVDGVGAGSSEASLPSPSSSLDSPSASLADPGSTNPKAIICRRSRRRSFRQANAGSQVTVTAKSSPKRGQCHRSHAPPGKRTHRARASGAANRLQTPPSLELPWEAVQLRELFGTQSKSSQTSQCPSMQPVVRHSTWPEWLVLLSPSTQSDPSSPSSDNGAGLERLKANVLC
mmetsp:Transcript_77243/g.140422  ORF Transcript_77243/g.140422 Transcript_77243/m.140422 type:complete len:279 (+) Transcript_77243:106-942(+)